MRTPPPTIARILALALLASCGGGNSSGGNGTGAATSAGSQAANGSGSSSVSSGGSASASGSTPVGSTGTSQAVLITPDAAPVSQVSVAINSSLDVAPISRFIYGINGHDFSTRPANLTLTRFGGNRASAYNWETNASNAGTDYENENDDFLSSSPVPGMAVTPSLTQALAANASMIVTVPMIGYASADEAPPGDVNLTPNYLATRFKVSRPVKGAAFQNPPNSTDGFVNQDEWVWFLDQTYPAAKSSATQTIFYQLDNEPDLWATTHPRLRGDPTGSNGQGVTYAELVQKTVSYANAIKNVVPSALVFGPVNYGWEGMTTLQNASDAQNRDFLTFYLQQMASNQASSGRRLLDVLDFHWYPEATGLDSTNTATRITASNADPGVAAARMAAPRSLWDPTYTETSWITQYSTLGPIDLLPRLQQKIAAAYPGTRIAVSEYNYGGSDDISGAIAQADVLGIFGRYGVFAAALWPLNGSNTFTFGGFEVFRNYDGLGGSFGDTSIQVTDSDTQNTSAYASVDSGKAQRMVVVAINRTASAMTTGVRIWHTVKFSKAAVYTLTSAHTSPVAGASIPITLTNAFQYVMPPFSVSTLVLTP